MWFQENKGEYSFACDWSGMEMGKYLVQEEVQYDPIGPPVLRGPSANPLS